MTELSDFTSPPAPEPAAPARRYTLPAEYYDTPPGPPALPRGAKLGCGIAALALLVVAFGGAAVVGAYGVNKLLAMVVDMSHGEMTGMYAKDVPQEKRKQVDKAIDDLSHDLANNRIQFVRLQPVLQAMKDAIDDKTVTNAEADGLLKAAADARKAPVKEKVSK